MNACFELAVADTVPLLRKPKKLTPQPEPMSHRTNGSNLHSTLSNLSGTLPPTRTPNTISTNRVRNSPRNDNKDFRVIKSGISQDESTVLPNPPTNSPTKPTSSELPDTAVVSYPLQPKGPAPFFPRNKKVFNTQASLYAQLFASTSPVPSSQDQFTLNDFQNIAKSISNNTSDSITTVIKSNQNYKKLTSWLEAFPPSQANLNTINLEGEEFKMIRMGI